MKSKALSRIGTILLVCVMVLNKLPFAKIIAKGIHNLNWFKMGVFIGV